MNGAELMAEEEDDADEEAELEGVGLGTERCS